MIHKPLERFMHSWDVVRCADHHFRRAIYGLGPHIADYPEQTAASGTVYGWCVTLVHLGIYIWEQSNITPISPGATPNPMTSTILTQSSGHENKLPPSSGTKTMTRCGTIMVLFQTSKYAPVVPVFFARSHQIPQPFTMRFLRADIHELLTPDLLHQVIKGTFKDHLVQWVEDYLTVTQGPSKAEEILDEIDRR